MLNLHRPEQSLTVLLNKQEFLSLSFSVDSKYLAAQSSGPDFLLSYFGWEKGKAIATIPSAPHGYNGTIRQIAINPYDATEISVIGEGLFKIFRYAEGVLRPTRGHLPPRDYRCHTWIQSDTIALATGDGHIYIVTDGAIVQELPFILGVCVESLAPLTQGFVAGGHQGAIIIYEQLVSDSKKSLYEMKQKIQFPEQETNVQTLVVSSSQGDVLVQTSKNQIFQVSLEPAEGIKKKVISEKR